jgi:hypothetical protein
MNQDDIFTRLEFIIDRYKVATSESLELETKNGKKLYRSLLNLLDDMKGDSPSDELFDDSELDNWNDDIYEEKEEPEKKGSLSMDDIIGDDDDEIW